MNSRSTCDPDRMTRQAEVPLPSVPDQFFWTREDWGSALRCRPLQHIASHVFTTRQLTLTGDDDLQRLASAVGAQRVRLLTQVHKAGVVVARAGAPAIAGRPEADVLVSDDPD